MRRHLAASGRSQAQIYTGTPSAPATPRRAPTTLEVGKPAATCPVCDSLTRVLSANQHNPLLNVKTPIFGRHSPEGTKVLRDDATVCLGTYTRARNLITYAGTFEQWWELNYSHVNDGQIELAARAAWEAAKR